MYFFLLFSSIFLAVIAQLLFKSSMISSFETKFFFYFFDFKILLGLCLYLISALLYIFSLKKIELSIAYPTVAISYIFIIFLSNYFFGESITFYKLLGCLLIVFGVTLLWR